MPGGFQFSNCGFRVATGPALCSGWT